MVNFENYTDSMITLYNDLYDKKVEEKIEGYLGILKRDIYPINPLKECQNIKKDFNITKNQWSLINYKIDEYRRELSINCTKFYRKERSWIIYKIMRVIIKIKYFIWIISWYFNN